MTPRKLPLCESCPHEPLYPELVPLTIDYVTARNAYRTSVTSVAISLGLALGLLWQGGVTPRTALLLVLVYLGVQGGTKAVLYLRSRGKLNSTRKRYGLGEYD